MILIPKRNEVDAYLTPDFKALSIDKKSLLSGTGNRRDIPKPKMAFDFNGSTDRVRFPHYNALNFGNGTTDSSFSYSGWIYMDSSNSFRIFDKNRQYLIGTTSGNSIALFLIRDNTTISNRIGRQSQSLSAYTGEWLFVTITYDGSGVADNIVIKVKQKDGTPITITPSNNSAGTYTVMGTSIQDDAYMGYYVNGTSYANGKLFDQRLHNKVLTGVEQELAFYGYPTGSEVWGCGCDSSDGIVAYNMIGDYHGEIENATLASFHYKGSDVPYSLHNLLGYNQTRQQFDLTAMTQDVFLDRADEGVDDLHWYDGVNAGINLRVWSKAASTDEDFHTKASGLYSDDGNYIHLENKNNQGLKITISVVDPIPSSEYEFHVRTNNFDSDTKLFAIYNKLSTDVTAYLDGIYPDTNGNLVPIGGDSYTVQSVIDWYDDVTTTQMEKDGLDNLLPTTFKTIALYHSSGVTTRISELLSLRSKVTLTGVVDVYNRYTGSAFFETGQSNSGGNVSYKNWFIDNALMFPQIKSIEVFTPRTGSNNYIDVDMDKSFIAGSIITGVNIADLTKGAEGFELFHKGRNRNRAKIVNVPVALMDGVCYLSFSDLSGITLVDYAGDADPTIVGNTITFKAGWISWLKLSNGSIIRFVGGVFETVIYDSVNSLVATWTSVTAGTNYGTNDEVPNYLLINGYELYDDDATHTDQIKVAFKDDGTRITPTITDFSKIGEVRSIEDTKVLDDDTVIDFNYYQSAESNLPSDYQAGDTLEDEMLVDRTDKERKLITSDFDISGDFNLKKYTRTA